MMLPATVRVTDVGPRDGLQNEPEVVGVDAKVRLVELLAASGVAEVEVSSFVSPRWVPQLGDAEAVFERLAAAARPEGVAYSALVPNPKGLERALAARAAGALDKIAIFTAASETFSRKNTNATVAESLDRAAPVIRDARAAGLPVRAYVSCVVACPYEGPVAPARVRDVVERLLELGADEIDLGETIGVAVPSDLDVLYDELEGAVDPAETTLHLHDTRGTALACALRGLELGVRSFDASCGGLGGCPYAPGAAGNLATEDLVYMCNRMGCATGVDLARLFRATRHVAAALGRTPGSRVFRADGTAGAEDGAPSSG